MVFKDIVAILERKFNVELAIVEGTTVFEVAGGDGAGLVRVLVQDESERNRVLLSADLGEPPPEGSEKLFRTMLEANNLFSGTAGATLALDGRAGTFRLQRAALPEELANDVDGCLVSFIETALTWRRAIEDFRPGGDADEPPRDGGSLGPGAGFGMFPV